VVDQEGEGGRSGRFCGSVDDPDRYHIEDGAFSVRHGHGRVYQASDQNGQKVALKHLLDLGTADFDRVRKRHLDIACVDHDGLLCAHDCFIGTFRRANEPHEAVTSEDFEDLFVVSNWVDGEDFDPVAATALEAARIVQSVAEALDVLHNNPRSPLAHLDVKPSNVRIGPDQSVFLLDFEAARPANDSVRSSAVGLLRFMAPEQRRPDATSSTTADIYPLGVMLYESILGLAPLDLRDTDIDDVAVAARLKGVADPVGFACLVLKAVEHDPSKRPTARALAAELAETATRRRRRLLRRTRHRLIGAGTIIVIVIVIAFTVGLEVMNATTSDPVLESTVLVSDSTIPNTTALDPVPVSTVSNTTTTVQVPELSISIQNLVTDGEAMREDTSFVRLLTQPVLTCPTSDCVIAGTLRSSNETYDRAICTLEGDRVTNGQDRSPDDDANPLLYESTNWFGVETTNNVGATVRGFVPSTWIAPRDRNRLQLPQCDEVDFEPSSGTSSANSVDVTPSAELDAVVAALDGSCSRNGPLLDALRNEASASIVSANTPTQDQIDTLQSALDDFSPNPVFANLPEVSEPSLTRALAEILDQNEAIVSSFTAAIEALEQDDRATAIDNFIAGDRQISRLADSIRNLGTSNC